MGYLTVRTDGWRYTAWAPWNTSALQGDLTGALLGEELYDHRLNRWGASLPRTTAPLRTKTWCTILSGRP